MNTALFLISTIAGLAVGIGGIVTYLGLRSAPDGYEDTDGFHKFATHLQQGPVIVAKVAPIDSRHGADSVAA